MDLYQKIIANSRYARYIPTLNRRETWEETVDRLVSFIKKNEPELDSVAPKIKKAKFEFQVPAFSIVNPLCFGSLLRL